MVHGRHHLNISLIFKFQVNLFYLYSPGSQHVVLHQLVEFVILLASKRGNPEEYLHLTSLDAMSNILILVRGIGKPMYFLFNVPV